MAGGVFVDLADVYEAMIDWPKRLANEESFYRRWFDRVAVHSLVDVACGTGHHAAMFHSWGLRVEAADLSPQMIERARTAFGQPSGIRWVVRGFEQPIEPRNSFDGAVCVGNSLALASDIGTVAHAVRQMLASLRAGGLLVLQVVNLWRLPDGPSVWQKCKHADLPQGESLIVKGIHRCGSRGYVDLVVAPLAASLEMRSESVPFLGLEGSDLDEIAREAGATQVSLFGSYQEDPYERGESVDLIVVATK